MKVAQAETVLACVQEVLGSNIVRDNNIPRTGQMFFSVQGDIRNSTPLISKDTGLLMNPLTCTHQHITASKTEIHKTKRHGKSEGLENRVHSKTLKFKVSKNVVPVLHNETPRKITDPNIMAKFEACTS
jgi:hypothetical protein